MTQIIDFKLIFNFILVFLIGIKHFSIPSTILINFQSLKIMEIQNFYIVRYSSYQKSVELVQSWY